MRTVGWQFYLPPISVGIALWAGAKWVTDRYFEELLLHVGSVFAELGLGLVLANRFVALAERRSLARDLYNAWYRRMSDQFRALEQPFRTKLGDDDWERYMTTTVAHKQLGTEKLARLHAVLSDTETTASTRSTVRSVARQAERIRQQPEILVIGQGKLYRLLEDLETGIDRWIFSSGPTTEDQITLSFLGLVEQTATVLYEMAKPSGSACDVPWLSA
jgi:hypothetical protein